MSDVPTLLRRPVSGVARHGAAMVRRLLAAVIVTVVASTAAYAQEGPDAIVKACGADRRIEFRFGASTLAVAPQWIDKRSLRALVDRYGAGCPKQPIEMGPLFFAGAVLDAAKTPPGLGRPFLSLMVDKAVGPSFDQGVKLLPADAPPFRQTTEPYAEDVTQVLARVSPPKSPSARSYRVVYPASGGGFASSIVVTCNGEARTAVGRQCYTPVPYRFRDDLTVNYTFQQDRLPPPGAPMTADAGGMFEPDGVLGFDKAIRAWIDGVRKRP
jgi:hypothetical protein